MATGEMTADCPKCGQKLRDGWLRCPRCRELVPESAARAAESIADAEEAESKSIPVLPLAIGALLLVVAAGVGIARMSGGTPAPAGDVSSDRNTGPDAAVAAAPRPVDMDRVAQHKSEDERRIGYAAYNAGDLDTALARFHAAVEAKPDDPEARNNLAQVLVRLGRAEEALPHFDEAVRLDDQKWAYRFNRARAHTALEDFPRAIADYRAASELFPDDYATYYNLGLVYLSTEQYAEAVAALDRAVTLAPGEPSFLISLGTAYVGIERPDLARTTFEKYLQLVPNTDPEVPRVKALLEAFEAARSGT